MRRGFWMLIALGTLLGLGTSTSCTQDFDQFEPTGEGGSSSCPSGQKSCGGACVSIDDPAYGCSSDQCGACSTPNATSVCSNGACAVDTCNAGFTDCDANPITGCESDVASDPNNCGACLAVCSFPNASGTCTTGQCTIGPCTGGFGDCDGVAANGCEGILNSDPNNCGACGNTCTQFETCQQGACVFNPCGMGTADCDNNQANGCETQLGTNQDCGFCNDACNFANASPNCNMGTCEIQACNNGFEDCNNMQADGCEANLNSIATCGTCNNSCPANVPNAMSTCTNGSCTITCNNGFADCNGMQGDGCETNLNTSTANCGACGRACSNNNVATLTCAAGLCTSSCNAGFGNCTQPAAPAADNGCEIDISSHVFNCGACGRACSGANVASRSCSAGVCNSACDPGFANCTQPAAPTQDNGCETQAGQNQNANCGGCGNACSLMGAGNAMECDQPPANPATQKLCGCSANNECTGGTTGTCSTGTCTCGGTQCAVGEVCGAGNVCSCVPNGGVACTGVGVVCCGNPAGCQDIYADPLNCGSCGHACPSGFICTGVPPMVPACQCDADADCDGGTPGTCTGGVCTCGAATCAVGERCLPTGLCG